VVNTKNQIQVYHDLTAFWLDNEWKTPREKQLERQVAWLRQDANNMRAENKALKDRLAPLLVFENIPCSKCSKPMTGFKRSHVIEAFKNWCHGQH